MSEVLVDVKNLKKYFPTGEKGKTVKAVDDISFQIYREKRLALSESPVVENPQQVALCCICWSLRKVRLHLTDRI